MDHEFLIEYLTDFDEIENKYHEFQSLRLGTAERETLKFVMKFNDWVYTTDVMEKFDIIKVTATNRLTRLYNKGFLIREYEGRILKFKLK